jgi:KDO2-lipid IV(A) lauroyltransferase
VAVPLRKRVKRAVRSVVVVGAIRLVSHLPRRLAWHVGTFVGAAGFHVARKTRRLALGSLAIAFPEKSEAERLEILRAMFVHYGRGAAELVTIRSYDPILESYVELRDPELLREVMARGKGMVYVTGHVGSWELNGRRIARFCGESAVIAKASHDPRLNDLAEESRASGKMETLWREDPSTGRAMIRILRAGKGLGILIDQDTAVQNVFVPFFGRLAATPRSAADLALRFGSAVVVGTIHRKGDGSDDGHLLELTEVPYDPSPPDKEAEVVRITGECSRILEEAIRRHPAEWVWMHERWKSAPSARS